MDSNDEIKKIDGRFAIHPLDLSAMQRSVEAVCVSIETLVQEAVAAGDYAACQPLLRSALYALMHTSARAQEEYELVRQADPSLPATWTTIAFSVDGEHSNTGEPNARGTE